MDAPTNKVDYKSTLNLPKTDFPMKADLARREPEIVARWESEGLYQRILDARRTSPRWVFHDGPPYANGHIHYGHILNKTLKDLAVKSRTMMGHYVEFKPGWDCHGLPIELAVMRELGDKAAQLSSVEIRKACHDYAMRWVDTQASEFRRLGVFATWDKPYLTLDKSYEATIVRQLAEFARKDLLYRDRKPVHWCMSCKTALAEAEIEYDERHVSPSIYVRFAVPSDPGLYAVIWTTTPWTLPANHGIAYNPDHNYVVSKVGNDRYIIAEKLVDAFHKACGLAEDAREIFPTARFAELREARHPFLDRASRFVPGDHVTLEQGTGLVHTAPGHGADDYVIGKKFDLPVDAPVDDAGVFTSGPWQGEHVWKANPKIVEHLHASGALVSSPRASVTHSYPICWRCKNPIIFRATWQWFASLDKHGTGTDALWGPTGTLRSTALDGIGQTRWVPPWGENRIRGMIENRPDWVLSRQRIWGVPIPVFYRPDGEAVLDAAAMDHIASIVEREGVDAWFARSPAELLAGANTPLAAEAATLTKGNDIVDVWFESGVSWAAVCEGRDGLDAATKEDPRPVDLYLEGSDQHRGWFHSALLTSAATRGRPPYRSVLTHGFVLDERGRPYSKSEIEKARREGIKIEFIPPEDVIKTQGAELLRLWTASADFRSDIAYSRAHLTQLGESYRKIRNTARFLLGNLYDFDPAAGRATVENLSYSGIERYLYARLRQTVARVLEAYRDYEFHVVMRALGDLCVVDLSSLLLDVRKDRLYCDPASSVARRETQTVLYQAVRVLALLAAPVLCFTAEEIWQHLPRLPSDPTSVHLGTWSPLPATGDEAEVVARWEKLLAWRSLVQSKLEPFRAAKHATTDAHVTLVTPDPSSLGLPLEELADLFIVSQVSIERGDADDVRVAEASGHKCERCWKWTPSAPLCDRCAAAVENKS